MAAVSGRQQGGWRLLLVGLAAAHLLVVIGFVLDLEPIVRWWPYPAGRLGYFFMAAILAGAAVPLLVVAVTGAVGSLTGYALGFGVMWAGLAITSWASPAEEGSVGLTVTAVAMTLAMVLGFGLARRGPHGDATPIPGWLRVALGVEVAVLLGVGVALLVGRPDTLPWDLTGTVSIAYGWAFVGIGLYFIHAMIKGTRGYVVGPLAGFLAYDLILAIPFLQRFATVPPAQRLGLVVASGIVVVSALVALWYLLVAPRLMLRKHARSSALS